MLGFGVEDFAHDVVVGSYGAAEVHAGVVGLFVGFAGVGDNVGWAAFGVVVAELYDALEVAILPYAHFGSVAVEAFFYELVAVEDLAVVVADGGVGGQNLEGFGDEALFFGAGLAGDGLVGLAGGLDGEEEGEKE